MTRKDPIRFAYIGCGFMGQTIHIPNFSRLSNCNFMALAEVREELGKSVALRYGIPKVYRSHEDVARDPDIEAVGVSAPYTLQGHIAKDLLSAGKQVFMEKPMAVTLANAEAIVAAADAAGSRLMVGYMKRYDGGNLLLKSRLDAWRSSGEAGEILYARNHGFGARDWKYGQDANVVYEKSGSAAPAAPDDRPEWLPEKWQNAYTGYLQQWTHNINLLRFLLDDTGGLTEVKFVDLDNDGMTGIVIFRINGARAVVESGYARFHQFDEHTQVYFQDGWLFSQGPTLLQKEDTASVEVYRARAESNVPQKTVEYAAPSWSYREEAKHFLDCLQSGEPFKSSGADTVNDVRLYEEIYRSFLGL